MIALLEKYGDKIPYVDAEQIINNADLLLPYIGTANVILDKCKQYITNQSVIICSKGFEKGTVFLPQLLMSAEAAKEAFEVLKLQQKGIYRLQTGAAQPHVYATDLQMLNIPIVSIDKQRDIVNHIADIRTKAKALQAEGKAILEDAKRKVVQMIIEK